MTVTEIITNPPRDEYIDHKEPALLAAPTVARIRDLELKKQSMPDQIEYGLFRQQQLVGYMKLDHYSRDIWQVTLVQLAQAYKGMGYGTFLYDYAVMNDGLKLLSDATNTGGPHGSRQLWNRLRANARYRIVGYCTDSDEIIDADEQRIYNNQPNTRWLALPSGKTINESLTAIQQHMKDRYVVWYGPGTTTGDYFNY